MENMQTSIGIGFDVNDVKSSYEVIGTSDNYSFQEKLGRGGSLVLSEGERFEKAISLKGNYGYFNVRVFAVSDIGIRSSFIESGIHINPPQFDDTFTFSKLEISNLPKNPTVGSAIANLPERENNILSVSSEYVGSEVQFNWELTPPPGHSREGTSLSDQLLSDDLFDKFSLELKNEGTGTLGNLNECQSLVSYLKTQDISGAFSSYKNFSLLLDEQCFHELNIDRAFSLKVVAHDVFGNTSTGVITGTNYKPVINTFSSSVIDSIAVFQWGLFDTDSAGVYVGQLGLPYGASLYDPKSLNKSLDHLKSLQGAEAFSEMRTYESGEVALYYENVYKASGDFDGAGVFNLADWDNLGPPIEYHHQTYHQDSDEIALEQNWGWSYCYAFQPEDGYGRGEVHNLMQDGNIATGSTLGQFRSTLTIADLRFSESADSFAFNWKVKDDSDNTIDLNRYRFLTDKSAGIAPRVLGLSGSLFDADTNLFLSGLTQGTTQDYKRNTLNIDSFEYKRELNNLLYGTEGWPGVPQAWSSAESYSSGDLVLADTLYDIWSATSGVDSDVSPYVSPTYSSWKSSGNYTYQSSPLYYDVVSQGGSLYAPTGTGSKYVMGPLGNNVSGVYNELLDYVSGDKVICPLFVNIYSSGEEYAVGDKVLYEGNMYKCGVTHDPIDPVSPGGIYPLYVGVVKDWWWADPFRDAYSDVYLCTGANGTGSVNHLSLPSTGYRHWHWEVPETSSGWVKIIDAYPLSAKEWSDKVAYTAGDFVSYSNDIWSGSKYSGPMFANGAQPPSEGSLYWDNEPYGNDITTSHQKGNKAYFYNSVYTALSDNPTGSPMKPIQGHWGVDSQWMPYWEQVQLNSNVVYKHLAIPQSGKRSVGFEIGIIDRDGKLISSEKITADNPAPAIQQEGFSVNSLEEAEKVKFNFKYAFGHREKVTKVELYRSSSDSDLSILDSNGLPGSGAPTFVQSYFGGAERDFGQNITQITDTPPITNIQGEDQIVSNYYKILPYDDFGSGYEFDVSEWLVSIGESPGVLCYPKTLNNKDPSVPPGPILRLASGDMPGAPSGFSGSSSFENYFLKWSIPPVHPHLSPERQPNDLSHYELWSTSKGAAGNDAQDYLYFQSEASKLTHYSNTGYRRILGDVSSVGLVPNTQVDASEGITNATNILNVDASSPYVNISVKGSSNEKRYFWVRAVDQAGNKGPFTGSANLVGSDVLGLDAGTLGQVKTTDVADFEQNITKTFPNTLALVPTNPFENEDPNSNSISWPQHFLYQDGDGYVVSAGNTDDSYVYWNSTGDNVVALTSSQSGELGLLPSQTINSSNPLRNIVWSGRYDSIDRHPAGNNAQASVLGENNFIIARNSNGLAVPMWHAFANASIGTAHIQNAAITNLKIHTMTADKITAGEIHSEDVQIGGTGQIRSAGFEGLSAPVGQQGFALSGDGSFIFAGDTGRLYFDNGVLTIEGIIREKDGRPFTMTTVRAEPSMFKYTPAGVADGPSYIDIYAQFQNVDAHLVENDIKWAIEGGPTLNPFSLGFSDSPSVGQEISGFTYEGYNATSMEAHATLTLTGFNAMISGLPPSSSRSDSVTVYVSGFETRAIHAVTVYKNEDGEAGVTANINAGTQAFAYGTNPADGLIGPASVEVTGESFKSFGDIYYQFYVTGGEVQNSNSDTTITYTPPTGFNQMPEKIELIIRDGATNGPILAKDAFTMYGVKAGEDAYSVFLTNEAHTFPANENGDVLSSNLSDGSTEIRFFRGDDQYTYSNGGSAANTYSVASNTNGITLSSATVDNQLKLTPTDVTSSKGSVDFTITDNKYGDSFDKSYTFSVSSVGSGARSVALASSSQAFSYSMQSLTRAEPTGLLDPDDQYQTVTATAEGFTGTPYYIFSTGFSGDMEASHRGPWRSHWLPHHTYYPQKLFDDMPETLEARAYDGIQWTGTLLWDGDRSLSPDDVFHFYNSNMNPHSTSWDSDLGHYVGEGTGWMYQNPYPTLKNPLIPYYSLWNAAGGDGRFNPYGPVLAYDQVTMFGLKPGEDSYTVFLTNENVTFKANEKGEISNSEFELGATEAKFFHGLQEYSYGYVGQANTFGLSTSSPEQGGALFSINGGKATPTSVTPDNGTGFATFTFFDNTSDLTFEKKYTYTVVSEASGSRTASFETATQAFSYNQTGSLDPDTQSTKITGSVLGFTGVPYYDFITPTGSILGTSTNTFEYYPAGGGGRVHGTNFDTMPELIKMNVRDGSPDGKVLAQDLLTMFGVKPGEDSYTVFLTNETHAFPANSAGVVAPSDLPFGSTETRFLKGKVPYSYGTGPNTYTISNVELHNIAFSPADGTAAGTNRKFTPSSITSNIGSGVFTFKDNANNLTFDKAYTFTKSLDGASGEDGKTGMSPVYRGNWKNAESYYGDPAGRRGDVVYYTGTDSYYIAELSHTSSEPPSADKRPSASSIYWNQFGATFDSVATDLLLSKDVFVTNELVMGEYDANNPSQGDGGTFRSANKKEFGRGTGYFFKHGGHKDYEAYVGGTFTGEQDVYGLTTGSYVGIGFSGYGQPGESDDPSVGSNGGHYNYDLSYAWANYVLGGKKSVGAFGAGLSLFDWGRTHYWSYYNEYNQGVSRYMPLHTGVKFDIGHDHISEHMTLFDGISGALRKDSYIRYDGARGKVEIKGAFQNNSIQDSSIGSNITQLLENNSDPLATFIGGGYNNEILMTQDGLGYDSVGSSIVGGGSGVIQGRFSLIGNGFGNECYDNFSVIGGGLYNTMPAKTPSNEGGNFIGAGSYNSISGASFSSIIAGTANSIQRSNSSSIGGGNNNFIIGESGSVRFDEDNSPMGHRFLGHFGAKESLGVSSEAPGWVTGMWFPASGSRAGVQNWGNDMWAGNQLRGLASSAWAYHSDFSWIYIAENTFTGQAYSTSAMNGMTIWLQDPVATSPDAGPGWWHFYRESTLSVGIFNGLTPSHSHWVFEHPSYAPAQNCNTGEGVLAYSYGEEKYYALQAGSDGKVYWNDPLSPYPKNNWQVFCN